jgi:hypothetical protein
LEEALAPVGLFASALDGDIDRGDVFGDLEGVGRDLGETLNPHRECEIRL